MLQRRLPGSASSGQLTGSAWPAGQPEASRLKDLRNFLVRNARELQEYLAPKAEFEPTTLRFNTQRSVLLDLSIGKKLDRSSRDGNYALRKCKDAGVNVRAYVTCFWVSGFRRRIQPMRSTAALRDIIDLRRSASGSFLVLHPDSGALASLDSPPTRSLPVDVSWRFGTHRPDELKPSLQLLAELSRSRIAGTSESANEPNPPKTGTRSPRRAMKQR